MCRACARCEGYTQMWHLVHERPVEIWNRCIGDWHRGNDENNGNGECIWCVAAIVCPEAPGAPKSNLGVLCTCS